MCRCVELSEFGMELARAVARHALTTMAGPEAATPTQIALPKPPPEPRAARPAAHPGAPGAATPAPDNIEAILARLRQRLLAPFLHPPGNDPIELTQLFTSLAACVRACLRVESILARLAMRRAPKAGSPKPSPTKPSPTKPVPAKPAPPPVSRVRLDRTPRALDTDLTEAWRRIRTMFAESFPVAAIRPAPVEIVPLSYPPTPPPRPVPVPARRPHRHATDPPSPQTA